ncbi:hypothetical protein O6H91_15G086900 [Diphasiastrum complanatum]|uniref:Uncharacterized protein n=1 Tax=Diphasiastrum complanatum TaxID=34168 RepID=A0ACC2BKG4_DIPCM|nr:hypothetical protein O6H91_15G086900 [Diphasiastrum complanatum]
MFTVTALQLFSRGFTLTESNWNGNDPCGLKWQGVTCDEVTNTKIIGLSLSTFGLIGRLLPSVGNFINLESLDLSFNPGLTGFIPDALGNLTNLQTLNLQSCGFVGHIPSSLGNLVHLHFLALNKNQLTGNIPSSLGNLGAVTWFDLSENLISGAIPISTSDPSNVGLDNLTAAWHLHLNNNTVSGHLPKEICHLSNLIHLLLDGNNLSGAIPPEISGLSSLEILRLDNNKFEDAVPNNISQLSSLTELHLSNNSFNGMLPEMSGLQELRLLRLSMNSFSFQAIPMWLLNLTNLQTLEMDDDNLIGEVPPLLLNLPSLEALSFQSNRINGSLSLNFVTTSLTSLSLENNNITDISLYNNVQLQLSLGGNPICSDKRYQLSGDFCFIATNQQTWVPQPALCKTQCAEKIINPITCTCAFPLVVLFQFNAPSFPGINSARISSLETQLASHLNLNTNQVYAGSANFTDNHRLLMTVSIFPMEPSYALSQEQVFNIISQLSLQTVSLMYFGPFLVRPISNPPGSINHPKMRVGGVIVICGGATGAIILLAAITVYVFRRKIRAKKAEAADSFFAPWKSSTEDSGSTPNLKSARWFPYIELKKLTSDFSDSNEIGFGGYGKVYKGTLLSGETVAIKRAEKWSLQGAAEFKNEIELLSRVRHKNLVGLIGFCYDQGEQMLVYEYMPNGTLQDHLFGQKEAFDWKKRLELALDSAKGLVYLHEQTIPPIIHRDVKSSNILLDDNMVARIADFGLSRLIDDGKGHVTTQVKGTLGYLDPAYYMTQKLTDKSDVYSFGIVLFELVTAKHPIENGKFIVLEVQKALEKGVLSTCIDPSLGAYPEKDLKRLVNLALDCVVDIPNKRPSMDEVAKVLEALLNECI